MAHTYLYTDENTLEDSYWLVKHFTDFPLWEYRITGTPELLPLMKSFALKEAILNSQSGKLVGILQNISISEY